jgi:hypothetical protein
MTRSRRRLVAWLGILGIAFAQFAVTAHACMASVAVPEQRQSPAAAMAHDSHCGGQHIAAPATPHGNACEVQCSDGAPPAIALAIPFAALPSQASPIAPVSASVEAREWLRSTLPANSTAPPLPLRFCRLLI